MEYKKYKQKPAVGLNKTAVDTQEFATLKTKKFGEPEPIKKKSKKHLKLPSINFKKVSAKRPDRVSKTIALHIQKSKVILKKLTKKQLIIISVVAVIIVFSGSGLVLITKGVNKPTKKPEVQGKAALKLSFTPIVAPGKTLYIDPEGKRDTGSYPDVISGINIRVSEQILPIDFKPDVDKKLESFAKTNYYNNQFSANGTKVFTGMSIKGVQSVVFSKNNLLIFIKAEQKIEDQDLVDYINSLR